jgi:hypothetical protein
MKHTLKHLQNEQDVAPQEFCNWKYVSGFSSHVDIIPAEKFMYKENFKPGISLVYKCGEHRIKGKITSVEDPVKVNNLYRFHYYVSFTSA